jgi:protein transport protein SEC24
MSWQCSICNSLNYLDSPATSTELAQLSSPAFEIAATEDYIAQLPSPPTYLFLIDVTKDSIESGFLSIICQTLYKLIEEEAIPGGERSKVALITYDKDIHYYCLDKNLQQPLMINCCGNDPVPVPIQKLFVDLEDCKRNLLSLLESLPKAFMGIEPKISIFLHVLKKVKLFMENRGGKAIFFQSENAFADIVLYPSFI